ncbi:MAG: hypothetical protein QW261_07380 [Candidatus Jordarchaeaceae archaeon]
MDSVLYGFMVFEFSGVVACIELSRGKARKQANSRIAGIIIMMRLVLPLVNLLFPV